MVVICNECESATLYIRIRQTVFFNKRLTSPQANHYGQANLCASISLNVHCKHINYLISIFIQMILAIGVILFPFYFTSKRLSTL